MAWRIVIKTVKGHRYRYRQRSFRVPGNPKPKTESIYLGRADEPETTPTRRRSGTRPARALYRLPAFTGAAWRADTGLLLRGSTALSVIAFEEQELGNAADFAHLDRAQRAELAAMKSDQIVWVTRVRRAAARYGDPERIDLGENARIVAEDGDGGFLVLRGDTTEQPERARPAASAGDGELSPKPPQAAKTIPRTDEELITWLMEPTNAKTWRRPYAASRTATFTDTLPLDRRILDLPLKLGVRISSRPWPGPNPERDNPWYMPDDDHIQLPDPSRLPTRNAAQSARRYHHSLLHELAHATGHPTRLYRIRPGDTPQQRYAFEEMVAETASCLVLNRIAPSDDLPAMSAAYVQHYAQQANPSYRATAFLQAGRAADYILKHWPGEV